MFKNFIEKIKILDRNQKFLVFILFCDLIFFIFLAFVLIESKNSNNQQPVSYQRGNIILVPDQVINEEPLSNTKTDFDYKGNVPDPDATSSSTGNTNSGGQSGGSSNPNPNVTYPKPTISNVIKVIELRFSPHGLDRTVYNPNYLSQELKRMIQSASQYKGRAGVTVQTVEVIDTGKFPNPGMGWEDNYRSILATYNLCQKIRDNKIDEIWMWIDPLEPDQGSGLEYSISSPFFRNVTYTDGTPSTPYCNGESSFVMFGFDTTRTPDLALHSFSHMMEAYLGNVEGIDLFWQRFAGNHQDPNFNIANRCGNVHFPPNTTSNESYGYYMNRTVYSNGCEDWKPDLSQSARKTFNCSEWGCTQGGYLTWWMQNMPGRDNSLFYKGKPLPNWFDFASDFANALYWYRANGYYISSTFISNNPQPGGMSGEPASSNINVSGTNSGCNCVGGDSCGHHVATNQCGFKVSGGDSLCYTCSPGGWTTSTSDPSCGCVSD